MALTEWAQRARAISLIACVGAGVIASMIVLDQISIWAHVFVLTYGTLGLLTGFLVHRFLGLPLLERRLRARSRQLAHEIGLEAATIEGMARAYLV